MTDSVDTKIRSLMIQVVDASPLAPDIEEISAHRFHAAPTTPIEPERVRRPWLTATASAAAVFVVLGGFAVLLRLPSSDTVAPATQAAAAPEFEPSLLTWTRVPDDTGVFVDRVPFTDGMMDVTVGGPGLVAVGQGDDGVAVWTSVDGAKWSRVPHDDTAFGPSGTMQSVTAGGPGLVAVGGSSDFDDQDGDAIVWTSVDGTTWSRVPHDEAVFGGEGQQRMENVTTGGPGLVAVGWVSAGDAPDSAVWTSVDGIAWSRVPHDDGVFGGAGEQTMHSVTVGGPGLVAVGADGFDDGIDRGQMAMHRRDFIGQAAVWTSVDGTAWTRITHDEATFGGDGNQWMESVTTGGPGLVAVGGDWSRASFSAAVWTSTDGTVWDRVPHNPAVFGGENDQAMNDVLTAGSGLVAVGRVWGQHAGDHSAGGDDSAASVWTSEDGVSWSWLGYDEAIFGSEDNSGFLLSDGPVFTEYRQLMRSAVATESGVVAVGADWSGPSHGAAVWVGVRGD